VRGDDRLAARAVTATTVSCGDGGSIYLSVGGSILVSAIVWHVARRQGHNVALKA